VHFPFSQLYDGVWSIGSRAGISGMGVFWLAYYFAGCRHHCGVACSQKAKMMAFSVSWKGVFRCHGYPGSLAPGPASGKKNALGIAATADKAKLGLDEYENLLQKMLAYGWVARIKAEEKGSSRPGNMKDAVERWTLLSNPNSLRVADVFRAFAFPSATGSRLGLLADIAIERGLDQSLNTFFSRINGKFQ
jgi:hypothetical protein